MAGASIFQTDDKNDDLYYLSCLKEEIVKIADYLLTYKTDSVLLDDLNIKDLKNRMRFTKLPAAEDIVREQIEHYKEVINTIKNHVEIKNDFAFFSFIGIDGDKDDSETFPFADRNENESETERVSSESHSDCSCCLHDCIDDAIVVKGPECKSYADSDSDSCRLNDWIEEEIDNKSSDSDSCRLNDWIEEEIDNKSSDSDSCRLNDWIEEDIDNKSEYLENAAYNEPVQRQTRVHCGQVDANRVGDSVKGERKSLLATGIQDEVTNSRSVEHDKDGVHRKSEIVTLGRERSQYREENVKPFSDLKHALAPPYMSTEDVYEDVKSDSQTIVCRKYTIIDRNWTDIILFPDYYLVSVQIKDPSVGEREFLNKYTKDSGTLVGWLRLPDAGKFCKINNDGLIAALQIGPNKCYIAVVASAEHTFLGTKRNELRILYRICVKEVHTAICCLAQIRIDFVEDPFSYFKFAVVYSSQERGKHTEVIDVVQPIIGKRVEVKSKYVHSFEAKRETIYSESGICSIDRLRSDQLVVSVNDGFVLIDINGNVLERVRTKGTNPRVTDVCCYKRYIFVCFQDKRRISKFKWKHGTVALEEGNVLKDEVRKPCQISVCGHELLIREFRDTDYSSDIFIRIIDL